MKPTSRPKGTTTIKPEATSRMVDPPPSPQEEGAARIRCLYRPSKALFYRSDAEGGDAEAQFNLGRLYFEGAPQESRGVSFTDAFPQDHVRAAMWLQKAADQGHAESTKLLGVIHALAKAVH